MKGNISKFIFRGSKTKVVIVICIALILIVALILALKFGNGNDGKYQKPSLPDIQFNGDGGFTAAQQDNNVVIPATTGIVVKSNTTRQKLNILNPSGNKYVFVVDIYLNDGTKLYTSDYIYPAETITSAEFTQKLNEGLYRNALMVYTCCTLDDQHTPLTRYEFPIEIRSLVE